ncbi:isoaspartyl peptidase/L-asparaginase family protein [Thalassotalea sediminis]|uniref:isoaspartyl peptidase/L-asparaginase family protein n=1 Tax=Thalassotalea sediminis TaxID=1759089 RepID=UPI0025728915|nr:isoaspartyl peptidase/L-asparaginase [Thalassotalea sediminis]
MKNTSLFTLLTAAIFAASSMLSYADEKVNFAIAIHGGAGAISQKKMTPAIREKYENKLAEAVNKGYALLEKGASSEQAIIAAIKVMEDSPLFNAGRGAVYTYDEEHELDASIMNGKTLNAGAVSGVKTVKSPITLAQSVMNNSVHVMLSGKGAETFARQENLALVDNQYFNTERRYKSLQKAKEKLQKQLRELKDYQAAHQKLDVEYKVGTVGAVALDKQGNLAAGTSTGGMTAKRFGRIGDSPIIGAGTYANNNSCAVSATGHGEYFIRYHVAADICARMQYQNISVQEAADTVINKVLLEAGGTGGVVVIDKQGNITMPFNTEGMYRASRSSTGQSTIAIFKNE